MTTLNTTDKNTDATATTVATTDTKPFIDNSHLDLRAKPTTVAIQATTATTKTKSKAKAKAQTLTPKKGDFATHSLVAWCLKAYSLTKLDRNNGTVYHINVNGSHKKLIKTATFENKAGIFFGGMVNGVMAPLATSGNNYLTVHHSKSNVYKVVRPTLTYAQIITLSKAIVKVCGTPKIAVGAGFSADQI